MFERTVSVKMKRDGERERHGRGEEQRRAGGRKEEKKNHPVIATRRRKEIKIENQEFSSLWNLTDSVFCLKGRQFILE